MKETVKKTIGMLGSSNISLPQASSVIQSATSIQNTDPNSQISSQTPEQNLQLLFCLSSIEVKDDFEEKMCRCYGMVQSRIAGKNDSQVHEILFSWSRESQLNIEEITLGLLVSILLEPHNADRLSVVASHISRDNLQFFTQLINIIITEHYHRLHKQSRKQLLWLCRELLRINSPTVEVVFYNILRQISCGDTSPENLLLIETVLDILIENRQSYDQNIFLLQYALFKFLRLIADHTNRLYQPLRQKESNFCAKLLSERFVDFLQIGRDFIRLLQQVARLSEFEPIWKSIFANPSSLSPKFNLLTLLRTRTHRRFTRLLLTFEQEKKLYFLATQVRFGQQRRYQDWLGRHYLNSLDSGLLRCDFIRFICNNIHPTNEQLATDLVPRWAIIGWLLNSPSQTVSTQYAKMAVIYDWLFFDDPQSIMDLEPGMLLIYFSMRQAPQVTNSILDFLCRTSVEFCPSLTPQIKQSISQAFLCMLEKRVVQSLSWIFDKTEPAIRLLFQRTFPDLSNELQQMVGSVYPVTTTVINCQYSNPQIPQPPSSSSSLPLPMEPITSTVNSVPLLSPTSLSPPCQSSLPTNTVIHSPTSTITCVPSSSSQQPQMMMTTIPLAPSTNTSIVTNSRFSDDEDDLMNGNNNSINTINHDLVKPPPEKKLKKSNSFGSSGSNCVTGVTKLIKTNSNGFSHQQSAASLSGSINNNNEQYIANILNSTVMQPNNNSAFFASQTNSNLIPSNDLSLKTELSWKDESIIISQSVEPDRFDLVMESKSDVYIVPEPLVNGNLEQSNPNVIQQIKLIPFEPIKNMLNKFYLEDKNLRDKNSLVNDLCLLLLNREVFHLSENSEEWNNKETMKPLALSLLSLFLDEELSYHIRVFPVDHSKPFESLYNPDTELIRKAIEQRLLFKMIKTLVNIDVLVNDDEVLGCDESRHRTMALMLMSSLADLHPKWGFNVLYYLTVAFAADMKSYRDYVRLFNPNEPISQVLLEDLTQCAYHDFYMFFFLLPTMTQAFSQYLGPLGSVQNNMRILELIVTFADYVCINYLCALISTGKFWLFKKEFITTIFDQSLQFDAVQQEFVWMLILEHNFSIDTFVALLPKLDNNKHTPALLSLKNLLKHQEPNFMLIKHLTCREPTTVDPFTVQLLIFWAKYKKKSLTDGLGNYVSSLFPSQEKSPTQKRNKRTASNVPKPNLSNQTKSIDHLLHYLDETRKLLTGNDENDQDFFQDEYMTIVLDQLRQICTGQQKEKYEELFEHLPDDDNDRTNKNKGPNSANSKESTNKRNQNKSKIMRANNSNIESDTESDSSEEDMHFSKKTRKFQKKTS